MWEINDTIAIVKKLHELAQDLRTILRYDKCDVVDRIAPKGIDEICLSM